MPLDTQAIIDAIERADAADVASLKNIIQEMWGTLACPGSVPFYCYYCYAAIPKEEHKPDCKYRVLAEKLHAAGLI